MTYIYTLSIYLFEDTYQTYHTHSHQCPVQSSPSIHNDFIYLFHFVYLFKKTINVLVVLVVYAMAVRSETYTYNNYAVHEKYSIYR